RAGGRDRQALVEYGWRALVRCQFHDTLAGTVSDEVAQAARARHAEIAALTREIIRGSVHDLVGHDPDAARTAADHAPTLALWNPATRDRGGITIVDVTLFQRDVFVGPPSERTPRTGDGYRPFAFRSPDGMPVPTQILSVASGLERIEAARHYPDQDEVGRVRAAIRAPLVSGMGFVPFTLGEVGPSSAGKGDAVTTGSRSLSNAYLDVRADAGGAITLTDRRNGERYAGLLELVSETDAGDAYTFCPGLPRRTARASGPVSIRKLATGPLVGALELRYFLKPHSGLVRVRVVLMLYAD